MITHVLKNKQKNLKNMYIYVFIIRVCNYCDMYSYKSLTDQCVLPGEDWFDLFFPLANGTEKCKCDKV